MNEPRRLIHDDDPALRALFSAAQADRAPGALEARTLRALGIGGVALGAASAVVTTTAGSAKAAASIAPTSVAVLTKWLGIGMVAGIGVVGSVHTVRRATTPALPVDRAAQVAAPSLLPETPGAATAPAAANIPAPAADAPIVARPDVTPSPVVSATPGAEAPGGGAVATFEPSPASRLLVETRLVDAARAALARGDLATGEALLARHAQEHPAGELRAEAAYLRIEAQRASGDARGAAAAASALLRDHPAAPQAVRARAVLEQGERTFPDPTPASAASRGQGQEAR